MKEINEIVCGNREKEITRIKVVQMDNLRGVLGIKAMYRARRRFDNIERMGNEGTAKRLCVGVCGK